nr:MAG TPA: hypothetical protein [Caudoviricetes sp.]
MLLSFFFSSFCFLFCFSFLNKCKKIKPWLKGFFWLSVGV